MYNHIECFPWRIQGGQQLHTFTLKNDLVIPIRYELKATGAPIEAGGWLQSNRTTLFRLPTPITFRLKFIPGKPYLPECEDTVITLPAGATGRTDLVISQYCNDIPIIP